MDLFRLNCAMGVVGNYELFEIKENLYCREARFAMN